MDHVCVSVYHAEGNRITYEIIFHGSFTLREALTCDSTAALTDLNSSHGQLRKEMCLGITGTRLKLLLFFLFLERPTPWSNNVNQNSKSFLKEIKLLDILEGCVLNIVVQLLEKL